MSAASLQAPAAATREAWLNLFTEHARPHFEAAGVPLPKEIRISIGFASKGKRSKTIGECWASEASGDKHAEIFIIPSLQSDSSRVADVLTHELVHAALGAGHGHGAKFRKAATALGLTGKMTATVAGPAWHAWADPILSLIGNLPGASLVGNLEGGKKKQTTRMIKLECDQCGFTCRTTQKHIDAIGEMQCVDPDCSGTLEQEIK